MTANSTEQGNKANERKVSEESLLEEREPLHSTIGTGNPEPQGKHLETELENSNSEDQVTEIMEEILTVVDITNELVNHLCLQVETHNEQNMCSTEQIVKGEKVAAKCVSDESTEPIEVLKADKVATENASDIDLNDLIDVVMTVTESNMGLSEAESAVHSASHDHTKPVKATNEEKMTTKIIADSSSAGIQVYNEDKIEITEHIPETSLEAGEVMRAEKSFEDKMTEDDGDLIVADIVKQLVNDTVVFSEIFD